MEPPLATYAPDFPAESRTGGQSDAKPSGESGSKTGPWGGTDGAGRDPPRAGAAALVGGGQASAGGRDTGEPLPLKWSALRYGFGRRRTAMPRKRHKPEEIVTKPRQVGVLVSQGQSVADAVRSIVVTER